MNKRKPENITNEVFPGNEHDTNIKTQAINDDATQVFDDNVSSNKGQRKSTDSYAIETQIFGENATQLVDDVLKTETVSQQKRQSDQKAETQVFDEDATQCFDNIPDDNIINGAKVGDTQVFEDATQVMEDETEREAVISKSEEMEDKTAEATQAFSDEEGKMFDITAASTLAYEDVDIEPDVAIDTVNIGGDDAMQVERCQEYFHFVCVFSLILENLLH